MPSSTVLSKADWITVDAAVSNDLFFFNHNPLNLDSLAVTAPDGSAVKPENMSKGRLRAGFDLNLTQPGTYRLALINEGVFARWKDKATGQTKRARGTPENIASQIPADAHRGRAHAIGGPQRDLRHRRQAERAACERQGPRAGHGQPDRPGEGREDQLHAAARRPAGQELEVTVTLGNTAIATSSTNSRSRPMPRASSA